MVYQYGNLNKAVVRLGVNGRGNGSLDCETPDPSHPGTDFVNAVAIQGTASHAHTAHWQLGTAGGMAYSPRAPHTSDLPLLISQLMEEHAHGGYTYLHERPDCLGQHYTTLFVLAILSAVLAYAKIAQKRCCSAAVACALAGPESPVFCTPASSLASHSL